MRLTNFVFLFVCFVCLKHVIILLQNQITCGLLRSDYLAHYLDSNIIKQVEINTIASSFGGISTHMTPMHRYEI